MLEKLPVKFGSVNTGKDHVRIGVEMDRARLTLDQAEQNFCGYRLGVLLTCPPQRAQNSPALPGMEDADQQFEGIADAKSYSVKPGIIRSGLTFAISSIDATHLLPFAQREGFLTITSTAEIPDDDDEDVVIATDAMPEVQTPQLQVSEGQDPGAAQAIRNLPGVTKGLAASLEAAGIVSVRHLEQRMSRATPGTPWYSGIKGVGETKHDLLVDAIIAFRQSNPVPSVDLPEEEQPEIHLTEEDKRQAYEFGAEAEAAGKPLADNPYMPDDPLSRCWATGWEAMHKQTSVAANGDVIDAAFFDPIPKDAVELSVDDHAPETPDYAHILDDGVI